METLHRRDNSVDDTSHDFPMAQFYADHERYLYQELSLNPNFSPAHALIAADTLKMLGQKTAASGPAR
jgi:hypothetical protein